MKAKITAGILLLLIVFSLGCRKAVLGPSGSAKCEKKVEVYGEAVSNFISTPTTGSCNSLKNALKDLVLFCLYIYIIIIVVFFEPQVSNAN